MLQLPIKNNKYLLVGSYAMCMRPSRDIDVICYEADLECEYKRLDEYTGVFHLNGVQVECLFADKQESLAYALAHERGVASTNLLYALKAGHIHYPSKGWEKHILDYHILRGLLEKWEKIGRMSLDAFIKLHKKSTAERLGKQRLPKLKNVTKEQFFDDFVEKHYDHDDIHQWFAHKEKPMYSYMQPDPSKVDCSKEMWEDFDYWDKVKCVQEECYVIASERHLIPQAKGKVSRMDSEGAFKWALMRVCTTLCSGWFRDFAVENYFTILNNRNRNYPQILNQHINA